MHSLPHNGKAWLAATIMLGRQYSRNRAGMYDFIARNFAAQLLREGSRSITAALRRRFGLLLLFTHLVSQAAHMTATLSLWLANQATLSYC